MSDTFVGVDMAKTTRSFIRRQHRSRRDYPHGNQPPPMIPPPEDD